MSKKRRRQQRSRNRRNNKETPIQELYEYEMIDGNWTARPYAYCRRYLGYLTKNMTMRHGCEKRHCSFFHTYEDYEEWRHRPENLPDYVPPTRDKE